ncbi:hypothetical protein BU24DRAFT_463492 [Aaosphaeria arxii CBS 175.79]|uniref:Mid2 domain-containing protein n=1 Tax=Aaosphaeria arxii CBS 175.79 TaxID=1450172 RepID=A0A6A5XPS8_9PLEO|nr:uncharacterized protein BU24DRAFT_463492 [Aaosphaeria arxii CBS 175.79]KAF2014730.1 hypothetical protein BU24DRAFT_463492 [Aaosphaeria arxii CBS 175.79]
MLRLSIFLLPAIARLATAECFFPNGTNIDSTHLECPSTGKQGGRSCCADTFACLSNGLCADQRYPGFKRLLRGGCTSDTWGAGCSSVCYTAWPDRDEHVIYCGNGNYCCDGDDCCTRQGAVTFDLEEPKIVATPIRRGGSSTAAPPSNTSPPTDAASPSASIKTDAVWKNHTQTTAIGVGVGVGVGVALILAVGIFIYMRRRKNSKVTEEGVTNRSLGRGSINPFAAFVNASKRKSTRGAVELSAEKTYELPVHGDPKEIGEDGQRNNNGWDRNVQTWPR